jgi:hypothetical protein
MLSGNFMLIPFKFGVLDVGTAVLAPIFWLLRLLV